MSEEERKISLCFKKNNNGDANGTFASFIKILN